MKIESIELSDNEISNKGASVLFEDLDSHEHLKKLMLKNNKVFETLGETACIFVLRNKNITQLSLEKNMIKHSHLAEINHKCKQNKLSVEK